jgi:hypothetical protein
MIKHTFTFISFLLMFPPIACDLYAEGVYDAAARMKAWDQHVKLREESIFKDVPWMAVGPRIQGGKIESIWVPKTQKNTIYAGAGSGNLWKSVNNGTTWKPIFEDQSTFSVAVVTVSDTDPNLVWVGTGEPHMARSSYAGTGVFKSTDAGKTWRKITKGLPTGEDLGRMGIAVSRSNPNVLYIIAAFKGGKVYRSDDKGESWRKTHEGNVPTGIGYDFCLIRVCPDNENEVFVPGFNLIYSPDGGKTFTSRSEQVIPMLSYKSRHATPHCDNHDMFIDPDNPDRVMLGTDGGLYISYDRAKTWIHINTLPLAEFYAISADAAKPYRIWGGTQDNGALGGEAKPMNPGMEHWKRLPGAGGDRYVTRVDPNDLDTVYCEGMFGAMHRRNLKTGEGGGIRPGGKRFNWVTPYILSPHKSTTIYAGAEKVFKSLNRGDEWKAISPDLTTNPGPEKQGDVPFGLIFFWQAGRFAALLSPRCR